MLIDGMMVSWRDMRGAKAVLGVMALWATLLMVCGAAAGRALADAGGEFLDPSPNAPPAASVYNTAPTSCPVTNGNPFCELDAPSPSLPPADTANPERYLNSAYWPAEKRPDIEMYAIQQYGYNYQNCSDPSTWNHYCFLVDAEAVGYPVTHVPQVGDLFLARCQSFVYVNPGYTSSCPLGNIYYLGNVEQVFPDGSFIITEGGGGAGDSGLGFQWLSAAMDPNSSFIGFFPPGQAPHLPPIQMSVVVNFDNGIGESGDVGSGSVSDSNGQTCRTSGQTNQCVFTEPQGVPITFTETTQAGGKFEGWQGACSGSSSTCTATETLAHYADLEVNFIGSRPGTLTGSGSGSSGGGTGPKPVTAPVVKRPRIARVTTAPRTIHATISGSHLVCKLSRWTGHRWGKPRSERCGSSVTYRKLIAGRYRLTVVSGKLSVTRVVVVRPKTSHPRTKSAVPIWQLESRAASSY
jgi:hypothetical protein